MCECDGRYEEGRNHVKKTNTLMNVAMKTKMRKVVRYGMM